MPIFIHSTTTTTTTNSDVVSSSTVFRFADRSGHRQKWSSCPVTWIVDGQLGIMMVMMKSAIAAAATRHVFVIAIKSTV
jgi:hypothetical protein